MREWNPKRLSFPMLLAGVLLAISGTDTEAAPLSFNRDVRPILAGYCYDCHGPDEAARKAGLRLDQPVTDATLIQPGGEIEKRIHSADREEVMPPPEAGKPLNESQKKILTQWLAEGARQEKHWAFIAPNRPQLPKTRNASWPLHPIDRFVLARLEQEGLQPSPQADPDTLIRRLYLDLIGLPPTPEEADRFRANPSPEAYAALVNDLLGSRHYGERWARPWLDLARYSDTNGYEKDRPRTIWPYRDWVIEAINQDMPFDQFTIEQLAGDMLPGATREQRIATGFHRNTMLNEEGGIDPLEFRFYAMVDRVATTGTVWLGLTTGCAQCHSHKYDPISHEEYYSLMALLNNADEPDLDVLDPETEARREELQSQMKSIVAQAMSTIDEVAFDAWLKEQRASAIAWSTVRPSSATSNMPRLELMEDDSVFASGDFTKRDVYQLTFDGKQLPGKPITALRLEVLPDDRLPAHGPGAAYYEGRRGDFFLSEVTLERDGNKAAFSGGSASYGKISIGSGKAKAENLFDGDGSTGWSTSGEQGKAHEVVLQLKEPLPPGKTLRLEMLFERHFVAGLGRFRWSVTTDEKPAQARAAGMPDPLSASMEDLKAYYIRTAPAHKDAAAELAKLEKLLPERPGTLVFQERPKENPRPTFRHHRGEYLSPRERVEPGVPSVFPGLPKGSPANRLSFARWLVSDRNPLSARVEVNRAWQEFFGRGLMVSADDFGTQSAPPTHPELLDWLAMEFMERGWSRKELHRGIVMSATYQQSSKVGGSSYARDPENRFLSRGPRFRLTGETIRDVALAASGMLSREMGGPGVYPPQPKSVTDLAYGNSAWPVSKDSDRYRRSLYTFSKRTAPFAAYSVFDAPSGEICVARRGNSNTPLQSLTLLNDAMYMEMASGLAARAREEADTQSPEAIAERMFRLVLTRRPSTEERNTLVQYQEAQRKRLEAGELKSEILLGTPGKPEEAAWALTARVVLNLDECVTKE